jgi:hypothetical protein
MPIDIPTLIPADVGAWVVLDADGTPGRISSWNATRINVVYPWLCIADHWNDFLHYSSGPTVPTDISFIDPARRRAPLSSVSR